MSTDVVAYLFLGSILVAAVAAHFLERRTLAKLEDAKKRSDSLTSLLALEHDTNYRMACRIYGRAAVDKAIAAARKKGSN